MRQKAFHVVNMHSSVKFFSKIVLSHLNKKLKSRTHFYSNFKNIKAIDKDNLPLEYGGKVPFMDLVKDWKKELMQYHELRMKYCEMKVATDMYPLPVLEGSVKSLKIPLCCPELYEKQTKSKKEYSIQGSFRKLEFD